VPQARWVNLASLVHLEALENAVAMEIQEPPPRLALNTTPDVSNAPLDLPVLQDKTDNPADLGKLVIQDNPGNSLVEDLLAHLVRLETQEHLDNPGTMESPATQDKKEHVELVNPDLKVGLVLQDSPANPAVPESKANQETAEFVAHPALLASPANPDSLEALDSPDNLEDPVPTRLIVLVHLARLFTWRQSEKRVKISYRL